MVPKHRESTAATVGVTRADGLLPWDEIPDVNKVFDTTTDLLRALQMRWYTRLAGKLDTTLDDELEQSVVHGWRRTAADLPGLRAILDAIRDHPAIAVARNKEHPVLANAAGLAALGDQRASRLGARIESRARAITVETKFSGAA